MINAPKQSDVSTAVLQPTKVVIVNAQSGKKKRLWASALRSNAGNQKAEINEITTNVISNMTMKRKKDIRIQMNAKHSTEIVANAKLMKTAFTGQEKYTNAIQSSQQLH